ncbi:uncharacterized protein BDR25DRAFT_302765 [Lindgomyces ingoldianus]|uniref:Uncharacterized protein n=1 Tax=Lindgomyces ingoldianus TaxID=673940 RepID=A0ACB6R0F6_9PLEO|nr:uncharacterized protein BDR25DRAFT_302765 [Lindgomyces ingoldianus]KAF2471936.1 hypothetical protein BDR25DRAFT_302765 [Lindgomyces ingoldianus]
MVSLKSLVILAFAQLVVSRPSGPPAFQVTNLITLEPSGRPGNTSPYRVGFNVTDPGDSSAAFCEAQWSYADRDTGYPKRYLSNCTDDSYAFKFVDWQSYYNFTLDVKHTTKGHHERTTKLAKGHVDLNILHCTHAASGFSACNQMEGVAFPLPVYDVRKS